MGDRITLVEQLLDHHRSKAKELLVDFLQQEDVRRHVWQYLGQFSNNGNYASSGPPPRLDTAFESHKSTHPRLQHPDSPGTRRTLPPQGFPGGAPDFPASPPASASVASHSSVPEAVGRERILLVSCDDEDKELPVWSRSASVEQNLVADTVVYGRAQSSIQSLPKELDVSVPITSGVQMRVKVRITANLTWRRRREYKTNLSTFYVVPAKFLDTDIIFGSEELAKSHCTADFHSPFSPQTGHNRDFGAEELDQKLPPPTSTTPINRYHQPIAFAHAIAPLDAQPQYNQVEAMRARQRMHEVTEEDTTIPNQLSATTAPYTRTTHAGHDEQQQSAAPPAVSLHNAAQGSNFGHIRVSGMWDRTPISLTLDMDAPGEVFYQALCQLAVRRKRSFERNRTTLWLKYSKDMPHEEAYELRLSEEELEEGWETTVEWIRENKTGKGSHIYATVEVDTG